ncbi:MAG: hypothetical protein ABW040_00920 [Microbacteriaceae bacterium]
MTISETERDRQHAAVWSRVERDFYVGSRGGNFIGHIELLPGGRWEAHDSSSRALASYPQLSDAITALEQADARRTEEGAS